MNTLFVTLRRSLNSLSNNRVWTYLLAPTVLAVLAMFALSLYFLDQWVAMLLAQPPMSWLSAWGALGLAHVLASLTGWLAVLSASYLLAMLLTGIFVMPLLLRYLAAGEYADVLRRGSDGVIASVGNSVWAALLFIIGWLLTLPLWLVPGAGLFLPLFWMAWLNRRTFAYDALSEHATPEEWRLLRRRHGATLLGIGVLMAVLAHVPWIGLLAPSLAALAYIHYCLEALRQLRQESLPSLGETVATAMLTDTGGEKS